MSLHASGDRPVLRMTLCITALVLAAHFAVAEEGSYVPPTFSQAIQAGGSAPLPAFPASPLAGGQDAAYGGQFMDAHGRPIVMPANCCSASPGGYGGYCPDGCAGGYGDPMAVDFGGCYPDQCGPHYFDVAFGVVFLQGENLFKDAGSLTSVGVAGADRRLNVENDFAEYEPGWEIAARYDIGPLAVLEATYMGMYDIGYTDGVNSVDVAPGGVDFQLFSSFSDFGTGTLIPGIDDGQRHAVNYRADLQSTEFSYRRYWVGHNPRISGTYLLGARYLRFTDDFTFDSRGLVTPLVETALLRWSGQNDLVGMQFGGDAWICLRQGLRMGYEGTIGIYNNRFKYDNIGTFSAGTAPPDFANAAEGNQVAYASESEVSLVADIMPSWSIRCGYRVLYLNSLVTGENNIKQTSLGLTTFSDQAGLLFHGFQGGMEYVW